MPRPHWMPEAGGYVILVGTQTPALNGVVVEPVAELPDGRWQVRRGGRLLSVAPGCLTFLGAVPGVVWVNPTFQPGVCRMATAKGYTVALPNGSTVLTAIFYTRNLTAAALTEYKELTHRLWAAVKVMLPTHAAHITSQNPSNREVAVAAKVMSMPEDHPARMRAICHAVMGASKWSL